MKAPEWHLYPYMDMYSYKRTQSQVCHLKAWTESAMGAESSSKLPYARDTKKHKVTRTVVSMTLLFRESHASQEGAG